MSDHVSRLHEGRNFGDRRRGEKVKSHFCLSRESMGTQVNMREMVSFTFESNIFSGAITEAFDKVWKRAGNLNKI